MINLKNNLRENGIICFTLLTDNMYKNSTIVKNENEKEEWMYPSCTIMKYDEIINFTNLIGYCTDITGYHSKQTWFIFSMNNDIINIVKNNKNNLTDLPLSNNILWQYSELRFRRKDTSR